jgi:glycosyltransferase involved in cell wall biosynthesis
MPKTLFVCSPVYNSREALREFLNELHETIPFLSLLGYEVRCVAINDASTDERTLEILRNPPHSYLEVVPRVENGGACEALLSALNFVAERCQPDDKMAWLDSDGEHRPMLLITLASLLDRGQADLAIAQIIWRENHMAEHDRKLQGGMGSLEAKAIFEDEHRWLQHCPGYWMVSTKFLVQHNIPGLLRLYLDFYERQAGERARWGEDMTFAALVHHLRGRVDDSTVTLSHTPAPNRSLEKILRQYKYALAHLFLYPEFFAELGD